ncbi:hypothetical protein ACFL4D_03325, partial [Candidatus Margulisiibacteriota bacterium]
ALKDKVPALQDEKKREDITAFWLSSEGPIGIMEYIYVRGVSTWIEAQNNTENPVGYLMFLNALMKHEDLPLDGRLLITELKDDTGAALSVTLPNNYISGYFPYKIYKDDNMLRLLELFSGLNKVKDEDRLKEILLRIDHWDKSISNSREIFLLGLGQHGFDRSVIELAEELCLSYEPSALRFLKNHYGTPQRQTEKLSNLPHLPSGSDRYCCRLVFRQPR